MNIFSGKPSMKTFFYPLLSELKEIFNEGGIRLKIDNREYSFLPFIIQCNVDLPAKADVQEMVGPNGYYGCSFCLHHGEPVKAQPNSKAVIRYIRKPTVRLRTHQDTLNIYRRLGSSSVFGIKKVSCMIAANNFDLINGFSIDYLHNVCLGITPKLLDLWLNSNNHKKAYYISPKKQDALNTRILSIKPTSEITRKPRSMSDRGDFKGNEFRSLLLYYLRYALTDLLPMRYINHFQLLSSSIYILLQQSISLENIVLAERRLNEFADQFEQFYGREKVTMNLHLLRHMCNSVRHLGPLWAQSTFGFETNNGVLVRSKKAKRHFLQQIAWKYSMKPTVKQFEKSKTDDPVVLLGAKSVLSVIDVSIVNGLGFDLQSNEATFSHITVRNVKYTSKKSKVVTTIDYFVQLSNLEIAAIQFYFVSNRHVYALAEIYIIIDSIDHLMQLQSTNIKKIVRIEEIAQKLIYMDIAKREIVTSIPNKFEKT